MYYNNLKRNTLADGIPRARKGSSASRRPIIAALMVKIPSFLYANLIYLSHISHAYFILVIMVVFDLGNLMSLMHCQQWLNEASRSNVGPHHIFLVGAKKDLLVSSISNTYTERFFAKVSKNSARYRFMKENEREEQCYKKFLTF